MQAIKGNTFFQLDVESVAVCVHHALRGVRQSCHGGASDEKQTGKAYVYYRCTMYNKAEHPRTRVTESQLDAQVLRVFGMIRQPEDVRDWFSHTLREWSKHERGQSLEKAGQLQRELTQLRQQEDRLPQFCGS